MLSPSKLDPNYENEMARKKSDPAAFGVDNISPLIQQHLPSTGGLSVTHDAAEPEVKPATLKKGK